MILRRFIAILLMFCLPLQATAVLAMTWNAHAGDVPLLRAVSAQRMHAHHASGVVDATGGEQFVSGTNAAPAPADGCSTDAHCGGHCAPFVSCPVAESVNVAQERILAPHVPRHEEVVPPGLTLRPPIAHAS